MGLQVASVRYWGRPVLTYESASLRVFEGGRTDTIRSATSEMCEFALEFVKEKRVGGGGCVLGR
eukprot:674192-Hanusia_phi.AAC.3